MSIILDALRRVERERPVARPISVIDRRAAENNDAATGGFFHRRYSGLMATGALVAFTGGFCFAAGMEGRNPLHPETAEAMTLNETAGTVSTAVESRDGARYGEEETRNGVQPAAHEETHGGAANPMGEQGAGPLGEKGEISPRITAGPILPASNNRIEPRGIEPPAHRVVQAAPVPVFSLDGIVYHDDPEKRAALLRVRGGENVLLNIGSRLGGYRVSAIGPSGVTLAITGGKKIELVLD